MTDQEAMKLHELIDELRTKLKKSLQDVLADNGICRQHMMSMMCLNILCVY